MSADGTITVNGEERPASFKMWILGRLIILWEIPIKVSGNTEQETK